MDLILDLAGYRSERDLAATYAVEPAAGEGAFLLPMVRRLLDSLSRHGRRLTDAGEALRAYELADDAAALAADAIAGELRHFGATSRRASQIAEGWVTVGDYLTDSVSDRPGDVIVGNPPYIRYDDIPPGRLAQYRLMYQTMVGRGDIYIGFIEAALRQLAPEGVLGFICADRWMRSAYGIELRRLISQTCAVDVVVEMHNASAFENDVAAYPALFVIRRGAQGEALIASADASAGPLANGNLADSIVELSGRSSRRSGGFTATRLERWFSGADPWPSVDPERLIVLQLLESRFATLEDPRTSTRIGIGVATGADRVYVTRDDAIIERDRLLPLAMSADARGGIVHWSGHYLVDPWQQDGKLVDLERYPRLNAYLKAERSVLCARNIAQRSGADWYRTIDRVHHGLLAQHKLLFADMKLLSHPVLDRGETYPHHNLYWLTSEKWDLEVLGGLLLSRVAQLFIEAYCVKMRGGTLRFQAQYLRRIRVPDLPTLDPMTTERLRSAFREYDRDAATAAALSAYSIQSSADLFI